MRWLGPALARREGGFLDGSPSRTRARSKLGPVDGRRAAWPRMRWRASRRWRSPSADRAGIAPDFIAQLERLLAEVHARGTPMSTLHKRERRHRGPRRERPNLIDFSGQPGVGARWPWNGGLFPPPLVPRSCRRRTTLPRAQAPRGGSNPEESTPERRETYAQPPRPHSARIGASRNPPALALAALAGAASGVRDRSGMAHSEHEPGGFPAGHGGGEGR